MKKKKGEWEEEDEIKGNKERKSGSDLFGSLVWWRKRNEKRLEKKWVGEEEKSKNK